MCRYCNFGQIESLREIRLISPIENVESTGFWLLIDEFNGRHYLRHTESNNEASLNNFFVKEIKYCPFCGRKLGGNAES